MLMSRGKDSEGNEVIRPYTPITLDSDIGYFELVVKVNLIYNEAQKSHVSFFFFWDILKVILHQFNYKVFSAYEQMYPKGRMSHHFREMHEGEYLPVKGPKVSSPLI